jgi:hypothetical protein
MHYYEMQSRQASRGVLDYSALGLPGATWDEFDPARARAVPAAGPRKRRAAIQGPEAVARAAIEGLVSRGLLVPTPKGGGYRRSRSLDRVTREQPPPVQVKRSGRASRHFELVEAEQAVLRAVEEGSRVTRGDVIALTGLSVDQAKRLLAQLVARGRLVRDGRGRGVVYRAANGR